MSFRTVIISSHCKLEYSLNYLVYRTLEGTKRINLNEIHTVIIESTNVSITTALLAEMIKKKIKVIFCDEKRNPLFEAVPYYGDSISTRRIEEQMQWCQQIKDVVWARLIKEKIINQSKTMLIVNEVAARQIKEYSNYIEVGDTTNREGHAAKVYFNNLFGEGFSRSDSSEQNKYLNYGYSVLLSQINRIVSSKGYITQIGIHHKNDFNQFNLSCDLIEPFRPIVDHKALMVNEENYKDEMVNLLNATVVINGERQTLYNALNIYCSSVFKTLNTGDINALCFFTSYEL